MPAADAFAPFFYALLGALVAAACLWLYARVRDRHPRSPVSATFRLIDSTCLQIPHEREWAGQALTPRELEVARLVLEGKRNAEIARDLTISIRTVESHLQTIYGKLKVRSRTELARAMRDAVDEL
jgi:DNA-binding NarL/FixJ family response regulator